MNIETIYIGSIEAPAGSQLAITRWRDAHIDLPEEGKNVLMALLCGEEWTGFLNDDGAWRYVSGDAVAEPVTHWLEYPAVPTRNIKP